MTDDPSTNSDEWVWRCKYAASGFACSSVLDRHSILCGLTLATPSPVLDSERPGREQIPVMLRDLAGEVHGVTHENGTTASWLLLEAAGLIDAADAHRCPTPDAATIEALLLTDGPNGMADWIYAPEWYASDEYEGDAPWTPEMVEDFRRVSAGSLAKKLAAALASHPGGERE